MSTGNVRGLGRSQSEVTESLEIVPDIAHESFVFDTFAFLVTDLTEEYASIYEEPENAYIGTSTMSCFEYDKKLLGGLVVSIPFPHDGNISEANKIYDTYKSKFGERLVETVESRPADSYEFAEEVTASEIGLTEFNIELLNNSADSFEDYDVPVHTFGFIAGGTLNILYLISEDSSRVVERFSSVVRQLDTMLVFGSPQSRSEVTGTVFAPCRRVLNSNRLQTYLESEYVISEAIQFNLGNLDSPEIYLDSELGFSYQPQLSEEVSVSVIGSRNANSIERRIRETSAEIKNVDIDSCVALKSGVTARRQSGDSIFVGQTHVSWACDCESQVCPTVVIVHTHGTLDSETLQEVDELLQEVEGQEAFEVEFGDVTIDAI